MKKIMNLSCFFVLSLTVVRFVSAQTCDYSDFNEHHTYVAGYNSCLNKTIQNLPCNSVKGKSLSIKKLKEKVFSTCGRRTGSLIENSLKIKKTKGQARRNCHRDFGEYIVTKRDDVFEFNLEDRQKECKELDRITKIQRTAPRPSNGYGTYLNESEGLE